MSTDLTAERRLFDKMRQDLESRAMGEWALIRDKEFVGTYRSFHDAADEAVRRFGRGPYLIREIGAADVTLPASAVYAAMTNA